MLKCQIYTRTFIVFFLLFLIGCSGVKDRAKPRKPHHDSEIVAFMEERESFFQDTSRSILSEKKYISRERPSWATVGGIMRPFANYVGRKAYAKIGNKQIFEVADSLRRKIRSSITGNVSTRIERVIEDSVFSKVVQRDTQREKVRTHLFKVMSRHYSPSITFDGTYDIESQWTDGNNDTLWLFIQFNKTKYINERQERLNEEIRNAGEEAYRYLETSFKALNEKSDMVKALSTLGLASYWIGKGGGVVMKENLFDRSETQRLLIQRHEMIKEIDKNIDCELRNDRMGNNIATRDNPFKATISCQSEKQYDLNKVKLRIRSNSNNLNYPETVKLESDGSAEISFESANDTFDLTEDISVTFDVISAGYIPDKRWYKTDDYLDLLKELPQTEFKITKKEFRPLRVWAFTQTNNKGIQALRIGFQETLESELGKYTDYISIIPRDNWAIDYDRFIRVKDKKRGNIFSKNDQLMRHNHDLDFRLYVHYENGIYDMTLSAESPRVEEGGKISSQLNQISETSIRKSIRVLVQKFVSENFYRKIVIYPPKKGSINVSVNNKEYRYKKSSNDKIVLNEFSRFETQILKIKQPGYRQQTQKFNGEPFSFNMKRSAESTKPLDPFIPVQGTLKVSVVDSLTNEPIRFGDVRGIGSAPIITARKMYWFIPSLRTLKSDTSSTALFKIDKLGKYSVKVKKDFYNPPLFPKIVSVYDDEDPLHFQSNSVRFALLKKDIGQAKLRSAIIPGLGHYSLGKKIQGIGFMGSFALTVGWGILQNSKFNNEVNTYNKLKDNYMNSPQMHWDSYERDLDSSKNKIINHKNNIYGALILYGGLLISSYLTVEL